MNCQVAQNKIIALPDPRLLPDPLREHVAGCAACRAWAAQAARLETLVEQLAAPPAPADKKTALLGDLARGEPIITRPLAMPAPAREWHVLEFLQRHATVIGGLAAAVLVAVGIWTIVPKNGTRADVVQTPDDPFLRKMVQRNTALAKADTATKRLEILGGMADDLSAQARALARVASADELRDLARWYDKVVKNAILPQAKSMRERTLTPEEVRARAELLNQLATKLDETAAETNKLLNEVPMDAKSPLQTIAESARDGEKQLLVEMRGKN